MHNQFIHCVRFRGRAASRILHFRKAPNRHRHQKSLLSRCRFLSPATPFEQFGDQLPPLAILAGPFSKDLIRFLITAQCATGILVQSQPPGQPPSPLPPNSPLYPVSYHPPPLQFHNLTLNGVRGAGAGVVEENFKAPSAVKKKPIPPPAFFFFLKARVAFASSVPAPTPGTRSGSSRCCRTPRSGPGSRERRVTRSFAGGPCQPQGPLLLHQPGADPDAPQREKLKRGFYFKQGGRNEGTHGVSRQI